MPVARVNGEIRLSEPIHIDATVPAAPVFGAPALIGVSCPARSFCMAVDAEGRSIEFSGDQWSQPRQLARSGDELDTITCPTPEFCVAGSESGDVYQFNGSDWSAAQNVIPEDANANASHSPGPALLTVTCIAYRFCMAIDVYGSYSIFNGQTWSPPTKMATYVNGLVDALSCAPGPMCVVLGGSGEVAIFQDGRWSRFPQFKSLGTSNTGYGYNHVACVSTRFCVAVDENGDAGEYDGSHWSDPVRIDPHSRFQGLSFLDSVGCSSKNLCIAADLAGYVTFYADNHSWAAPSKKGVGIPSRDASGDPYAVIVSCALGGMCVLFSASGYVQEVS